jgi:uncharacterized protein YbjT (DUF2867 family)
MILVVGATGSMGNQICRSLISKNLAVKAMVRPTSDPMKKKVLQDLGVQVAEGDLRSPSGFPSVLDGVRTVITTTSAMPYSYVPGENDISRVDEKGMINLVDAARSAGVNHFIYTSFSGFFDLEFPLSRAKRKVEEYLQNSGMTYTILRPGCFMESWLSAAVGFDAVNGTVRLCGYGANPVAYISSLDVAHFAVECVGNPHAKNAVIELGGPENLSQLAMVSLFEDVLQKKIQVQSIPVETLQAQFLAVEDDMLKSFVGLMLCVAKGGIIDMKNVLDKFPVRLTSAREFALSQVKAD